MTAPEPDLADISAGQLKSIVDRILHLKEDQDAIAGDIREVYAEAKSNGFDKTILGQLVSFKRKEAKDASKLHENQAIFDLYLEAYERAENGSHTYARARGGNHETIAPKTVETIAQAVQTDIGRKALVTAIDAMIEVEEENSPEEGPESDHTSKSTAVHNDAGKTGVTAGETAANSDIAAEPLTMNSGQINRAPVMGPLGREECVTAPFEPTSSETPSGADTGRAVGTGSTFTLPDDHKFHVRAPDGSSVPTTWGEFRRMQEART